MSVEAARPVYSTGRLITPNRAKIRARSRPRTDLDKELADELNILAAGLSAVDWRKRHESITGIVELLKNCAGPLLSAGKLLLVLDSLCKAITDQNLKVQTHALNSFLITVPLLKSSVDPHLPILVAALTPSLSTTNKNIQNIAKSVFSALLQHSEPACMLSALCSMALHRPKAATLTYIQQLVAGVHSAKPQLLRKHLIPVLCKLVEAPLAELKEETRELVFSSYELLGAALLDFTPAHRLPRLVEFLKS